MENRKRGRLFCAEKQNKDGLLGWCLGKTASHLNLTSMWRREKKAVSSTQLTLRVQYRIVVGQWDDGNLDG